MPSKSNGSHKRTFKAAKRATAQAADVISQTTDQVRDAAQSAIAATESQLEAARRTATRCLAEGREAVDSMTGRFQDYVAKRPVKALAMAVGAGLFLGIMLRRR